MKPWTVAVAAALLFAAKPVCAQPSRPVTFEAGVVMGIIAQPYATVGVVVAPWTIRISGGGQPDRVDCSGLQLNVGRALRDEGNAKHTVGVMWARFQNRCWNESYTPTRNRQYSGQYAGFAYDFQVKGFFLETGTAFGAKNPVAESFGGSGPLAHVYGQIGYVYRFGQRHETQADR